MPWVALALGIAAAPGGGQDEDAGPVLRLSLADAIRISIENNIGLEIQEVTTEIARFDYLGSWGAFDPLFSVTGRYTDAETPVFDVLQGVDTAEDDTLLLDSSLSWPLKTGGSFDVSYSRRNQRTNRAVANFDTSTTDVVAVGLTQPLLRGAWSRFATSRQQESDIALRQQFEAQRSARNQLVLDVQNAYWDLVAAREELAVRDLAVELAEQLLQQEELRFDVGVGTEVDVLQAETNVAQRQEEHVVAEYNLRLAEDNLRTLIFQRSDESGGEELERWDWRVEAVTPLPDAVPARDAARAELDWMRSFDRALQYRPELWSQRLEIDAAEVRLERARSEKLPGLDFGFTASSVGFDGDPNDAFEAAAGYDFPTTEASLTFSMPIGNRLASYAERSARAGVRASRLAYDQLELSVLAEVRDAVREVLRQAESVQRTGRTLELAQRQLVAEQGRFEEGLSTTFQVREFQQDLAEALSVERASRAAYAKARALLERAEGFYPRGPRALGGAGGDGR